MRIAVLVYGRLNKCVEHYNNIINSIGKDNIIDFFMSSDNSSEYQLKSFVDLYKPILYNNDPIVYDCDLGKYPTNCDSVNYHNMTCHFINKKRVLSLLEEHIHSNHSNYDIVISMRIDLIFDSKFIFENIKDNTIYIPSGYDYLDKAINDQVAYGNLDVMKKYNSIFSNVISILDNKKSIPHPESLTYAHICSNNLHIERVNIQYHIDR